MAKKAVYHSDRRFLARIVDKKNIKKALATKSMEELKPLIVPAPERPTQIIENLSAILPPKDDSIDEIDHYIDDHAKIVLSEEIDNIF